ncbi:MAG: twin-arginine translocase TatA/TatE family subunit [Elusimicrobia bacterium]|nr:twin-arginine translocase TatA/TatE family subunit [Elusimicrobiota bacterium]
MPNLGYGELLLVLVVALIVFGPSRIPELARSMGRAVNLFKAGLSEGLREEPARVESKSPNRDANPSQDLRP